MDGDVRYIKIVSANKQDVLLAAVNDDKLKAFSIKKKSLDK
jgi:hypothetical protein